jgi:hypothetical protein
MKAKATALAKAKKISKIKVYFSEASHYTKEFMCSNEISTSMSKSILTFLDRNPISQACPRIG